jgi:hypothetical protein
VTSAAAQLEQSSSAWRVGGAASCRSSWRRTSPVPSRGELDVDCRLTAFGCCPTHSKGATVATGLSVGRKATTTARCGLDSRRREWADGVLWKLRHGAPRRRSLLPILRAPRPAECGSKPFGHDVWPQYRVDGFGCSPTVGCSLGSRRLWEWSEHCPRHRGGSPSRLLPADDLGGQRGTAQPRCLDRRSARSTKPCRIWTPNRDLYRGLHRCDRGADSAPGTLRPQTTRVKCAGTRWDARGSEPGWASRRCCRPAASGPGRPRSRPGPRGLPSRRSSSRGS